MGKKIDLQALRQQVQELQIDKELKHKLLEAISEKKRYGLVWEESEEEAQEIMREKLPVFKEDVSKRLASAPDGSPNHVLIEGDNLNALTALTYTHAGKIDVIYIDPPYNTGNKDFVYNDSFVDKEDGYRHSKWLSFMDKRLKIAKKLLSEKGVIFISIDDNEQAQLKMLCDENFGNQNFCGELIWRKKSGGGQTDIYFVTEHEYILVYQKTPLFKWKDPIEIQSLEEFKFEDSRGKYNLVKLEKWGSSAHKEDRPSMYFPITDTNGNEFYPVAPDGKPGRWRVGLQRMENILQNSLIEWRKGRPYEKVYFDLSLQKQKIKKSRSILYDVAENADGSYLLTALFGKKDVFINPKPMELIWLLLTHHENKNATILDFFAGSGTTLHATMQLNSEDGGHRQCILVTNNENGICENVTYERNKRVIQGYTTPKGEQVAGLTNNNLRYYKTDFVSRENSVRNRRALMASCIDLLCIKNNIYHEEETFGGRKFKKSVLRYFKDNSGQMLVVLDERVVSLIVPMIAEVATKKNPLKVYVYSDGAYAYDDEFKEVLPFIELSALPYAFVQALESEDVLPEQKVKEEEIAEFNEEEKQEALNDTYNYVEKEGEGDND